ncbi:MAG TPA: sucrase ferredoxin [Dermatophilaceae bacterium]|nr:sucrase ferredoxin [Dermatophilaceae bacterium]
MSDPSRCSAAARQRKEPLAGTAPVARRWLAIEHPGPWVKQPLETPPLKGPVMASIDRYCKENNAKALLIRRHRRSETEGPRDWYAVDTVRGTAVSGSWSTTDDLLRASEAIGTRLNEGDEAAPPMLLVCSHATRDPCCAFRGRPVTAALERVWGDEVWECTHLGGHRFAATLLSLPDGACYGGLDIGDAVKVVRAHREGAVSVRHLRGPTRWKPAQQAAVAWALARYGPAPLDAVVPGPPERLHDRVVRLELAGTDPVPESVWVQVETEDLPPAPLTCGGPPGAHVAHHVTEVRAP